MKKFLTLMLIFTLTISMGLVGCGSSDEPAPEPTPAPETQGPTTDIKVGMVTDVGGVNDNSFNQSAWEGLQKVSKDTGAEVDFAQSTGDVDYNPNLNDFVKNGWDLTWGIGFMMADAVKDVALQNPESNLAIIDGYVDAPNVVSVSFKEHEGSFLVGVVAGLTTKTNKIGFVGGMDIPVIVKFEEGFKAGVKAVNPDAEVLVNYTGAFDKSELGKAAAATMYDNGADIIFHAAGSTGDGVFTEAISRKNAGQDVWVIGVDKDQSLTFGNDVTLTSMMKRVDVAVYDISKSLIDGKFEAGTAVELGLVENGVGLPENNPNVSEEILLKVKEYKDKIINGEIIVPSEKAE
ncbi:MAG: BMP family protein [Vulcanibacillus sp.]